MSAGFPQATVSFEILTSAEIDASPAMKPGQEAARRALVKLGLSQAAPPTRGSAGEPVWPAGVVGSISHTKGAAVAAVAWAADHQYLGIDLERADRQVYLGTSQRICTERERQWLELQTDQRLNLLRIFCAKEAIFKGFYPLVQRFFGFQEAEVSGFPDAPQAQLTFSVPGVVAAGETFPITAELMGDCLVVAVVGTGARTSRPL